MVSEDLQRVSDQLVRLVQVFFALVLGQSLVLFKEVLLDPFTAEHWLATLAWATVFYTTVASWVDWHVLMAKRPYDTRQLTARFQFYSDVGIAVLYAYLLFTIEPLIRTPNGTIFYHLIGYPFVFAFYLASGFLRRWVHGKVASRPIPLFIGLAAYTILLIAYEAIWWRGGIDGTYVNALTLGTAFVLMVSYRWYRRWLVREDEAKLTRLTIGVDVDGVLADQITGVLPLVKERHDVTLAYADITHWRLPFKDSDIEKEILLAQQDRDYVVGMKVHEGAGRVLKFIRKTHRIAIITARRGEAGTPWTTEWLRKNGLPYDEVLASGEAKKSEHRADVLVDDFLGNIVEFLTNTKGVAVLVDQPWNRERDEVANYVKDGRLFVVSDLLELRMSWTEIVEKARAAKEATEEAA